MIEVDPGLARAACLYIPLSLTAALLLHQRPDRRMFGAAALSLAWNIPALLVLHVLAGWAGWWSFPQPGHALLGLSVELYLGWALLWGPVSLLALGRLHPAFAVAIAGLLDLVFMPLLSSLLTLGPLWPVGEAIGVCLCFLPALFLGRWTRDDVYLTGRLALQVTGYASILLGVIPSIVVQQTGGSLETTLGRPGWLNGLALQILLAPVTLGITAVSEFGRTGRGTPVPFDPPKQLVITGPYAYLRSPMQLSCALLLAGWGWFLDSPLVAAGALIALVYGAGFAGFDEDRDMALRFGKQWDVYRQGVPKWWPRWRPYVDPQKPSPTLYIAETCDLCSQLAAWVVKRQPAGLQLIAAENHAVCPPNRLTYEWNDGSWPERGVMALARTLEHINLGWALLGWILRLPLLSQAIQLLVDASGGGPRRLPTRGEVSRRETAIG